MPAVGLRCGGQGTRLCLLGLLLWLMRWTPSRGISPWERGEDNSPGLARMWSEGLVPVGWLSVFPFRAGWPRVRLGYPFGTVAEP